MSLKVTKNNHPIDQDTRLLISNRYKRITKAVNVGFWNSASETAHSRYVGSYGRGTAINTSDLDVLIELPYDDYERFTSYGNNGQSKLLQVVKNAILNAYPNSEVKGDGQVVVINFSEGMKFEILPAFKNLNYLGLWDNTYKYPDTHMGGNWMSTNPLAEQNAMKEKDKLDHSNGLLTDTCKHIRYLKSEYFSSFHLSGILVDSFVYEAINDWHWLRDGEKNTVNSCSFEKYLLDYYNKKYHSAANINCKLLAPGSGDYVEGQDLFVIEKILNKMV